MIDANHKWNKSIRPQVLGFLSSLILLIIAYFIVTEQLLSGWKLTLGVISLGCLQALLQLIFFLQLGVETKPRWNLMLFLFMLLVIFLVVGGSLWIMQNLDYNMTLNT